MRKIKKYLKHGKNFIYSKNKTILLKQLAISIKDKGLKNGIQSFLHEQSISCVKEENYSSPSRTDEEIISVLSSFPIRIFTTRHCHYIAKYLASLLEKFNIYSEIVFSIDYDESKYLYVVISPNAIEQMPTHYIAYQVEQTISSRWLNDSYLNKLKSAYAVFDYSMYNISYWEASGFSYKKLYYLPINIINGIENKNTECDYDYDVLFYGDPNCPRRKLFLDEISKEFNIKIAVEVYNEELYDLIRKSKVVINVHYYENALLETTRLYELLSLGKVIISEVGVDQSEYSTLSSLIDFVDIGDMESMIDRIKYYVDDDNELSSKILYNETKAAELVGHEFYLGRFLLNFNRITFESFVNIINTDIKLHSDTVVLSIPECVARKKYINQIINNDLSNFGVTFFDGLRKNIGYVGCGLSYKFLSIMALKQNMDYLIVFEDDITLGEDSVDRINRVINFAKNKLNNDKWDIISGFMAEFNDEYKINNIFIDNDVTYIETDKMVSTVFNIYNKSALKLISNWDHSDYDRYNQIDQYLKKQSLKVLLVFPFLVGHNENLDSAVWEFSNAEYNKLINPTIDYIEKKISLFSGVEIAKKTN